MEKELSMELWDDFEVFLRLSPQDMQTLNKQKLVELKMRIAVLEEKAGLNK